MVRKRKKHAAERDDPDTPPKAAKVPEVGTGLKALLERAGLGTLPPAKPRRAAPKAEGAAGQAHGKPALGGEASFGNAPERASAAAGGPRAERPKAPYTTAELSALNQAYRGVAPIRRSPRTRVTAAPKAATAVPAAPDRGDEHARQRLAELVGGGVRFDVSWDDGFVQALRAGGTLAQLARAQSARFEPEARLDLHGRRQAEAQRMVGEFVRAEHRRGARRLLIIVGKGEHSEDGVGVLGRAAVDVLTAGVAAPLVGAVASAHASLGGRGALAVVLL